MAEAIEQANAGLIAVLLVYSPAPRQVLELTLSLPVGASVRDALRQAAEQTLGGAGCIANLPSDVTYGIWNRSALSEHPLTDGDRLEIYRPLRVDPKVARRERFKKQGAKSAGLFATRRPGAKPGY